MSERHSLRKPAGVVIVTPEFGAPVEMDCMQCVHCGGQWVYRPGSGALRGWCGNCAGFICGPACAACVPFEKKLDLYEKGKLPTL